MFRGVPASQGTEVSCMARIASVFLLLSGLSIPVSAQADVVIVRKGAPSSTVVVKSSPPKVVVVRQEPVTVVRQPPPPPRADRERKVGLHFDVGGAFGRSVSMGGLSGALRIRPLPQFALDLGAGYFAGQDFDGDFRSEVPVTANLLFFVNPKHKAQFYFLAGGGASFARKEDPFGETRDLIHAGGQAGIGLEFRLARFFALNTDVRGFLRKRVDNDPRPEFVDGGRSTDVSGGVIVTFGGTLYF